MSVLGESPPGTGGFGRVQEYLQLGLGKHLGSDVSAFHDHPAAPAQFLLRSNQDLAHPGKAGHSGGRLSDGFRTNGLGHVRPVQNDAKPTRAGP